MLSGVTKPLSLHPFPSYAPVNIYIPDIESAFPSLLHNNSNIIYTHIICNTHVYYSVLTNVMEKIAAMGIRQLCIFRGYFSHDLFCDLWEVSSTWCIFCENYSTSCYYTIEDRHCGKWLEIWNSNAWSNKFYRFNLLVTSHCVVW